MMRQYKSEHLASFSDLSRSKRRLILYLTMHVYCVYPALSKSHKQPLNCLKRGETSIVLVIVNGVLYTVHAYNVIVSYRSLYINQVPGKLY